VHSECESIVFLRFLTEDIYVPAELVKGINNIRRLRITGFASIDVEIQHSVLDDALKVYEPVAGMS
jgi:hypothetical protein